MRQEVARIGKLRGRPAAQMGPETRSEYQKDERYQCRIGQITRDGRWDFSQFGTYRAILWPKDDASFLEQPPRKTGERAERMTLVIAQRGSALPVRRVNPKIKAGLSVLRTVS